VAVNELSGGGLQRQPGRGFDVVLSGAGMKTKAWVFCFFSLIPNRYGGVGPDLVAGWATAGLARSIGGFPLFSTLDFLLNFCFSASILF
jgi:hypothetical protein